MEINIKSVDELDDAIENHPTAHIQKNIAILLLDAMNDWLTPDQSIITEFTSEFSTFFGTPVTIKKINSKSFNGQNAWQLEASSSIIELIKLSKEHFKESNFEAIIESCLKHFESQ